jgi:uncharacterized membrane protein YphA (DoxX/SURF4 family)
VFQAGEGFEFDILFLAISTALTISGSGRFSVDTYINTSLKLESEKSVSRKYVSI